MNAFDIPFMIANGYNVSDKPVFDTLSFLFSEKNKEELIFFGLPVSETLLFPNQQLLLEFHSGVLFGFSKLIRPIIKQAVIPFSDLESFSRCINILSKCRIYRILHFSFTGFDKHLGHANYLAGVLNVIKARGFPGFINPAIFKVTNRGRFYLKRFFCVSSKNNIIQSFPRKRIAGEYC
jgi:hypothetical protein